jgi:hypothetical protein
MSLENYIISQTTGDNDTSSQVLTQNTLGYFKKDHTDMSKEMDNRFTHQDRIVRNISHFIGK